ncbi:MAG TPA: cobalamin-dependent protein, partial [Phycisphaerae bacterium]|nr:cobalamin-dependent protein [Phycisphaerae bacterium]
MRIALVNPIARRTQGYHTIGSRIPQLGLQVLAQLVPPEHHVDLIDEVFGFDASDRCLRRGHYDLVCVTAYSSGATRAYEIAEQCRREGIPTIMGGPHASAVPEEAARYFDAVAVGGEASIQVVAQTDPHLMRGQVVQADPAGLEAGGLGARLGVVDP